MENNVEQEMVKFGNYLLSQDRDNLTSEKNKCNVTDADLANYKYFNNEK